MSERAGRAVAIMAAIAAVAWAAAYLLVPSWIARDPERNMAKLGLVGRRMTYSAFQHYWPRYNLVALGLVLTAAAGLAALSTEPGQRLLTRLLGPLDGSVADPPLTASRLTTVRLVWLLILLPQLLAAGSGFEAWPFSPYGMYSAVQAPLVSVPRLAVLTDSGAIAVNDPDWLKPFDTSRLDVALARLIRNGDTTAIQQAAGFALSRYQRARASRDSALPPATAIGLYRDTWFLQPGAANRDHPDSTIVIFEQRIP